MQKERKACLVELVVRACKTETSRTINNITEEMFNYFKSREGFCLQGPNWKRTLKVKSWTPELTGKVCLMNFLSFSNVLVDDR